MYASMGEFPSQVTAEHCHDSVCAQKATKEWQQALDRALAKLLPQACCKAIMPLQQTPADAYLRWALAAASGLL